MNSLPGKSCLWKWYKKFTFKTIVSCICETLNSKFLLSSLYNHKMESLYNGIDLLPGPDEIFVIGKISLYGMLAGMPAAICSNFSI